MTNRAYASGQEQTKAGGVIVAFISLLAVVLVIAGLIYATGTSERHKGALAAAGCEPNLSASGLPCTTAQVIARQYAAITTPVIQQLNADVAAYTANKRRHLRAAEAALMAQVTLENALGTSLARFPFAPTISPRATALITANRALAELTAEQARSSSLAQLGSFTDRVKVASAAVQTDMELLTKALQLRPTANQEP